MRGKRKAFFILMLVLFICYEAISIMVYSIKDDPVESDAAIVLGAAVWGDEPSPVLKGRIDHAVWLYENEYVDHIIFTGGGKESGQLAESEVSRKYALGLGVEEESISIETQSTITEENLKWAKGLVDEKGFETVTIVSDPLHMKRAMMMADHFGLKASASPTPTSAYQSWRTKLPFFFRELFFTIGYIVSMPLRWLGLFSI